MTTVSLPAQIARTRRFTLGVPGQFTVGPDGAEVLLPGAGHQAPSGPIAERLVRHQVRFLQRHLGVDPKAGPA